MSMFQSASMVSLFIGPPIGGLLLMQGALGLQGWQWLFIIEDLPPVIMCFVTWKLLTDRPKYALWLTLEQRTWHVVRSCLVCSFGLVICIIIGLDHPYIMMVALCLAVMGQQCISPLFWSIPSAMLTGVAAAGGLAMINAIGNLGGWLGPSVYGIVKDVTGSTNLGLLCLAVAPVISAIALVLAGHDRQRERMMSRS